MGFHIANGIGSAISVGAGLGAAVSLYEIGETLGFDEAYSSTAAAVGGIGLFYVARSLTDKVLGIDNSKIPGASFIDPVTAGLTITLGMGAGATIGALPENLYELYTSESPTIDLWNNGSNVTAFFVGTGMEGAFRTIKKKSIR